MKYYVLFKQQLCSELICNVYKLFNEYYIISCRLVFKFVVYAYRVRQVGLKSTRISERKLTIRRIC